MSSPMALTLSQFDNGKAAFSDHYFLAGCSSSFTGNDIRIPWASLSGAVGAFITENDVPASSVALRFVYCYDTADTSLYLRMQILTMTESEVPGTFNLNVAPSKWYSISQTAFNITTVSTLSDSAYLNNFFYCGANTCSTESLVSLNNSVDGDQFAQTVTMPWLAEINQLFLDNGMPTDAQVGFAAICLANVAKAIVFQHTLAIYVTNSNGVPFINNVPTENFEGKAADMGTLCPMVCGEYVVPQA